MKCRDQRALEREAGRPGALRAMAEEMARALGPGWVVEGFEEIGPVGPGVAASVSVAVDPVERGLVRALASAASADEAVRAAVSAAREAGWSWARIASLLGVTPQAAWKKFGRGEGGSTPPR